MEPIGVIYRDVVLEVDKKVVGATKDFVSDWYADSRGWYYWGGGIEELEVASDDVLPVEEVSEIAVPEKEEEDIREAVSGEQPDKEHREEEAPITVAIEQSGKAYEEGEESVREVVSGEQLYKEHGEEEAPETISIEQFGIAGEEREEGIREAVAREQPNGEYEEEEVQKAASNRVSVTFKEDEELEYLPYLMNWGFNALNIIDKLWNNENLTGESVNIAILGTGINRGHPALSSAIRACRNFCDGDKDDVRDEDGLGTKCAGLIAGRGKGIVYGIAPKSFLFIGKIMDSLFDLNSNRLLDSLKWAIQQPIDILFTPVDLRESSLLPEEKKMLSQLVEEISNRGIILIAPVGNSAISQPEERFPAALPYCLSVGACGRDFLRYRTSLRSQSLDILAPGEDLLTTSTEGESTSFLSGSFAAAAFASGAVALIAEYIHRHSPSLTIPIVLKLIRETAFSPVEGHKWDIETGYGVIDPCGLLEAVKSIGSATPILQ